MTVGELIELLEKLPQDFEISGKYDSYVGGIEFTREGISLDYVWENNSIEVFLSDEDEAESIQYFKDNDKITWTYDEFLEQYGTVKDNEHS